MRGLLTLIALVVWLQPACAAPAARVTPASDPAAPGASSIGSPALAPLQELDTVAWVDSILGSLAPRQRVAQLVMFWTLGNYANADDSTFARVLHWVETDGAGGIVMSLGTPVEVAAKINYLQHRARVPLLVAADLEPSLLRLESAVYPHYLLETGGATAFPRAMAIAATGRDEDAYDVARAIAREARAVGIHVNFAPVVDVNVNPDNPVINTRSFGENPERVARLAGLFVRGTHAGGMFATAKHFPGHGDTDVDSHVGLPVIPSTMERLNSVELVPFRAAIAAGAEMVMSAHIALPALGGDSVTPATLRPDVMGGLLRDSLRFAGVTITDALDMQGVGKGYSHEEAVVLALKAGTDVLLNGPAGDATRTIDAALAAVERGEITQARIDSSARRILMLKARAGLATGSQVSLDSLREVVGSAENRRLATDVAQRALTLLRDSLNAVPFPDSARVAVVTYMPETELKAGRAFMRELGALQPTRLAGKVLPNAAPSQLDSIGLALSNADAIVLALFVRRVEGQGRATIPQHVAAWVDSVAASTNAVVVAFGNPYLLRQTPRARAYLTTYSVDDASEMAAARALAGLAPITGRAPVSLPGFFRAGDGIRR